MTTMVLKRDRGDKFREHPKAGVREYWGIDPREGYRRADFFYPDETGDYRLFATEDERGIRMSCPASG